MIAGVSSSALYGLSPLRPGPVAPVRKTGTATADPASVGQTSTDQRGTGATSQAQLQQQPAVQELQRADTSVRQHEAAHQAAGGPYAGSASFTYTRGPDGKNYATAGEVPVDTSPEQDPSATIRKMDMVKQAALAPADPSSQDLRVAQQAESEKSRAQQQRNKAQAAGGGSGGNDPASPALAARGAAAYASAYGLGQATSRIGFTV